MKKRSMKQGLSLLLAAVMLCAALPLGVSADVVRPGIRVNVVSREARVVSESTLYLGEIFVDGESALTYLYSDDVTRTPTVFSAVKSILDEPFGSLVPSLSGEEEEKGVVACTDAAYEADMDETWKDASAVAASLYPTLTAADVTTCDLYETDEAFAARCDEVLTLVGFDLLDDADQPVDHTDGVIGILSATNTDSVTYTVEDGVLVKLIDREEDYTVERIRVMYTAVRLTTEDPSEPSEPSDPSEEQSDPSDPSDVSDETLLGDANGDGSVDMKDVLLIRKFIANMGAAIDETAADVNRDGSVDMKDVLLIRKFIAGLIQSF